MEDKQRLPEECWDNETDRYHIHEFYRTKGHWHVSDCSQEEHCDLVIVETGDSRFFIEDNWGGDAKGHPEVFNPFDKDSFPTFFFNLTAANIKATRIVASITGSDFNDILNKDLSR